MISVYKGANLELLYAEPYEYFVEIHKVDKSSQFVSKGFKHFYLPMPGLLYYGQKGYGGFYGGNIIVTKENPILEDGTLNPEAKLFHAPLPHVRADSSICMHGKNENILESFNMFWQTKSKYWLNHIINTYLSGIYPNDVYIWMGHHMILGFQFFEDWESKYNVDNILEAPFCNLQFNKDILYIKPQGPFEKQEEILI